MFASPDPGLLTHLCNRAKRQMEPERDWKGRATLVDLLDRIFDKGVVLYADVIISVAGIPLIGVNLRAVLAGMETMLEYGVMQDMDVKTRMWESQKSKMKEVPMIKGEELVLKMYGSYHYESGIYNAWKSGQIYLTNTRLLLYQKEFDEKVFETPIDRIKAITVIRQTSFTGKDKNIIHLYLQEKKVVRLSVHDTEKFKQELESLIEKAGMTLDEVNQYEEEKETCPQCGILAPVKELLEKECSKCGWVSTAQTKKIKVEN